MVTIPMAFWASLEPCESAMPALETSWRWRKPLFTEAGEELLTHHMSPIMMTKPAVRPHSGEITSPSTTLIMPFEANTSNAASETPWSNQRCMTTAPQMPPTRACELDEGIPKYHVSRFQTMAPTRAATITVWVTVDGSAMSLPIVAATPVPVKAPMKLNAAAMSTAVRGARTLVETTVAIAFAVSWNPFM